MIEISPRIVVDPTIRLGKPVIKGTRVPVTLLLSKLAGGMTNEEIIEEYEISQADIRAALLYAANILDGELMVAA